LNRDWLNPPSLRAATEIQRQVAEIAQTEDCFGEVRIVAGADTSMRWRDTRGPIHAAIAPLNWPELMARPASSVTMIPPFPYVSGYLGFREAPALASAWQAVVDRPDLLLVDGQGRAHPRRAGIATHLGVILDVPTIGIAKTLLCGSIIGEVGPEIGDARPVVDRGETVAMALRTARRARPIFVSTGHRVSLATAVEWALRLSAGRRLPLPIRLAHEAANAARRQAE
jgi:deoxyribonuclease V